MVISLMPDAGVLRVMMTTMDCGRACMLRVWHLSTLSHSKKRTGSGPGTGSCLALCLGVAPRCHQLNGELQV
jgi:hypothetical protein